MGKLHTTNYFNTFIEVDEDCKLIEAKIPEPLNGRETIALLQYRIIDAEPYRYTSDDVLFRLHAQKKSLSLNENERELFFSKGRACFRASPLTKSFGWGIHFNAEGKMAIYAMDSKEYSSFVSDDKLKKVKAMRSKRA